MNTKPKVSVVIIFHNKEKYARECMDSVISQPIDMQIVCVDDFSTDKTVEILTEYEKKYPNIKVIKHPQNLGTVIARYHGLIECNGEYVYFVDGDDRLIPNTLNLLYEQASSLNADMLEFCLDSNRPDMYPHCKKSAMEGDILAYFIEGRMHNTLVNKLFSERIYVPAKDMINIDVKHDNYSDVIYLMLIFVCLAKNCYQSETVGYYYYKDRGMTNESIVSRLRHYCGFHTTYDDLCNIFKGTRDFSFFRRLVCIQALMAYMDIEEPDKEKYQEVLYTLMSPKELSALINERLFDMLERNK